MARNGLYSALHSTTAMNLISGANLAQPHRNAHIPKGPRAVKRHGSAGIVMAETIPCPKLGAKEMAEIDNFNAEYITRHFSDSLLPAILEGSFKFGTIKEYRPADQKQAGRFGDVQEGNQWHVYRSRTGIYDGKFGNSSIKDVVITGFENPIVREFIVNDYCCCASIGGYSEDRARQLRKHGGDDLGAFVVYDFKRLRNAIAQILHEQVEHRHLTLIVRQVNYGEKDQHWEVEDGFPSVTDRDALGIWLGTTFVKSPAYIHEEEVRMLLIDPLHPGALPQEAERLIFRDDRIASAIVASGHI